MNENSDVEVKVTPDVGAESIGKNAFVAASDGKFESNGLKNSAFLATAIVAVIFLSVRLAVKRGQAMDSGRAIPTPGVARNDTTISPKLLTAKDLTNVIPKPRRESSYLGKIKVIDLGSLSEIPIGSEMKAILVSGASDGIVKARLTSPLLVDGEQVVPEKAVLFGKGKSGDERLFVEFTRMIFPSGESFPIRAQAFDDSDRILGLKGAFIGKRAKKMAAAMAFGFLGGMADGLQDTSGSYFMMQRPSARDAALAGASKAALDQSQEFMNEMRNSPNIIEVKAGTKIVVITDQPKKEDGYEKE